jgi:hypothetical protein
MAFHIELRVNLVKTLQVPVLTQIRPYIKLMFRPYHICMRPTANPALYQMEKNN